MERPRRRLGRGSAVLHPGPVVPDLRLASSYVGEYVCHSGRTTGSSCGTVQQLNVKVTYQDGNNLTHMTKVTGGICGDGGDSGGPVYAGNYALGIVSGGLGCAELFYTEVKEIESIYGVHVTGGRQTSPRDPIRVGAAAFAAAARPCRWARPRHGEPPEKKLPRWSSGLLRCDRP